MNEFNHDKTEMELLSLAVERKFGYQLNLDSWQVIHQKVTNLCRQLGQQDICGCISDLMHDRLNLHTLLSHMAVPVTEMFRDPIIFKYLRAHIYPKLMAKDHVTVVHLGCATGEEVLSNNILLHETGLLKRARINAFDIDADSIGIAAKARYPAKNIRQATGQYHRSGGRNDFSGYYLVEGNQCMFSPYLTQNVQYHAADAMQSDAGTGIDILFCRNVLIHFDDQGRRQMIHKMKNSLSVSGYLITGQQERIFDDELQRCDPDLSIYQAQGHGH